MSEEIKYEASEKNYGKSLIPKSLKDIDVICKNVLMCDRELDSTHPGFKDPIYRTRRKMFSDIALNYNYYEPIPIIEYTSEETDTWRRVFNALVEIYPTHACEQYRRNLELLKKDQVLIGSEVPQLSKVSNFLMKKTGFRLRPCAGYLNPRDFLAALAFRVFNCTQYIRHHSDPFYTPEPDLCHEMLGHVPMLADKRFAEFSQEIGLASIGASDENISKLASCYLYVVEFGLCVENGLIKAYGAGLLSSKIELEHAVSATEKIQTFDPEEASKQHFCVTSFQPTYFLSPSIDFAKKKMREFISKMKTKYRVKFDSSSCSLLILDEDDTKDDE